MRVDWVLQGGDSRGRGAVLKGVTKMLAARARAADGHAGTVKREAALKKGAKKERMAESKLRREAKAAAEVAVTAALAEAKLRQEAAAAATVTATAAMDEARWRREAAAAATGAATAAAAMDEEKWRREATVAATAAAEEAWQRRRR